MPEPTPEQRKRFEAEFAKYWNGLVNAEPTYASNGAYDFGDDHLPDRTESEGIWVAARTYSEQ